MDNDISNLRWIDRDRLSDWDDIRRNRSGHRDLSHWIQASVGSGTVSVGVFPRQIAVRILSLRARGVIFCGSSLLL